MDDFIGHVLALRRLYAAKCKGRISTNSRQEPQLIDAAGHELKARVSVNRRRAAGAFFTGRKLADKLLSSTRIDPSAASRYFDPTCGAGDLLLRVARRLPVKASLGATLRAWGKRLSGVDRFPAFIKACHLRLALLAIDLGATPTRFTARELADFLPGIRVGDAFNDLSDYSTADVILLNPPFSMRRSPAGVKWASGRITAAALFVDAAIRKAKTEAKILAILPDVLRSGSRYRSWRDQVTSLTRVKKVQHCGVFDETTDIHVFLLRLDKRRSVNPVSQSSWQPKTPNRTVGKAFKVAVGPVVPFRHREVGASRPYVHARNVEAWKSIVRISERRRFTGTTFQPPFVVVKRTSRPEDPFRAVGTIIRGEKPVAIENHLLVCIPKDGSLSECRRLIKMLRTGRAKVWFDNRIRCRHLTVEALANCPLPRAA